MGDVLDVCIVGSGPAGLQAGYMLGKSGRSYRILERGDEVSSFFRQFPRHRQLISINKVHTGSSDAAIKLRYDWNSLLNDEGLLFTNYSGKYFPDAQDYVRYCEDFASPMQGNILCGHDVTSIARDGDLYRVSCGNGAVLSARHVIVATGVSRPYHPEIEGFDLVENYFDFDLRPEAFNDKRVLVIGKGNSAFETADALVEHAAAIHVMSLNPVRFAWNTHFVGHLRAVNNNFLDTYQLKSQNAVIDAEIFKIEKADGVYTVHAHMNAAEGHDIILTYDRVIACTGFRFDPTIFDAAIRPGMCPMNKFPAMTANWESETAPNLWFAGTITQFRDYRKTMSGFVHGFRHNVASLVQFIEARLSGGEYPHATADLAPEALAKTVVDRVSRGTGVFLQPGFLGDVIALDGDAAGRHYRDVPMAWALGQDGPAARGTCMTVTLEFGNFGANPMHVKRSHTAFGGEPDPFIHPVLRIYRDGELKNQTHLSDHLDSDWRPRNERGAGVGTVLRMTYADQGRTRSPAEVALDQARAFLDHVGIGTKRAGNVAAE